MSFEEIGIASELLRAVAEAGYETPTPIQEQAIPKALEGHDLMCCAQTGTGKTAAFALPILHTLSKSEKRHLSAVTLVPTRELAIQVAQNVCDYSRHLDLVTATAFGGVPIEPQEMMLRAHVDFLVATPGRLIDHMWRGNIDYRYTRFLVLDEADRMLDMGFIKDVREIVREIPTERQSMLFSATLDREIEELSRNILVDPIRIEVAPPATTLEAVTQYLVRTSRTDKLSTLEQLIRRHRMKRTIIFARTKSGASRLAGHLARRGFRAVAFHSDRSQEERVATLDSFKDGRCDLLVATDIASRGLDVDDVSHVVNYDIPYSPDGYVHRIGRTARAGRSGMAITLVTSHDTREVHAIERLISQRIPYLDGEAGLSGRDAAPPREVVRSGDRPRRQGSRRRGGAGRPAEAPRAREAVRSHGGACSRDGARSQEPARSHDARSNDGARPHEGRPGPAGTPPGGKSTRRRRRRRRRNTGPREGVAAHAEANEPLRAAAATKAPERPATSLLTALRRLLSRFFSA